MTIRSKQWYTKTSRLEYSFAKSSIGRRSSDPVLTTRSSVRRPVDSKFQIFLARLSGETNFLIRSVPFLANRSDCCRTPCEAVGGALTPLRARARGPRRGKLLQAPIDCDSGRIGDSQRSSPEVLLAFRRSAWL